MEARYKRAQDQSATEIQQLFLRVFGPGTTSNSLPTGTELTVYQWELSRLWDKCGDGNNLRGVVPNSLQRAFYSLFEPAVSASELPHVYLNAPLDHRVLFPMFRHGPHWHKWWEFYAATLQRINPGLFKPAIVAHAPAPPAPKAAAASTWAWSNDKKTCVSLTEIDARFGDGQSRVNALVAQTAIETDAILFEMRAAHDNIFSLAVDRQVVFSVRTRLFSDLAAKLASALAASEFVVHRKVSKRAATSVAVTITDANGILGIYEPAAVSTDFADVVYPSADTGSVDNLIASVPSRARGYALAGGVRTYLTGYRADAAGAADDSAASGAIARPWETAADELLTTATIIADTARIAGVTYCAYHAVADVPKMWVVAELVYNGWTIPPFLAGQERAGYSRSIKAAYDGGPSLKLVIKPTGDAEIHVTSSSTPPIRLKKPDAADEFSQWKADQVSKPPALAVGIVDRAEMRWSVSNSVHFKAHLVPAELLQKCGEYVKNSTLKDVVVDSEGKYVLRWEYESGVHLGKKTINCGYVGRALGSDHANCTEAAVPRLVRLAAMGNTDTRRQLRDELASASPFTSTLKTAEDVAGYNTFVSNVKHVISQKMDGSHQIDGSAPRPFVLHACHNPTSGASSGRDDVPVIRMGADGLWCTGQHALAATTGMLLASNYACT